MKSTLAIYPIYQPFTGIVIKGDGGYTVSLYKEHHGWVFNNSLGQGHFNNKLDTCLCLWYKRQMLKESSITGIKTWSVQAIPGPSWCQ